ncbi:MAG: response regulator transcription factor [Alphaproteobacteria bacterium]|nr:response regulator transcription factor [Alphaproteobacteria bacterium]
MSETIALIDDEDLFRETLAWNLTDAGFQVEGFARAEAALDRMAGGARFSAVLLDWQMPGMNGLAFLRALKEQIGTEAPPVLFLTGLDAPLYEERGLGEGAVDFIEKTRSVRVIVQRLRLAIAGTKGAAAGPAQPADPADASGDLDLDVQSARAQWKHRRVELTLSEFKVVQLLAERSGRDVSYREIYDQVKGVGFIAGSGAEGHRANVRALIKRIRQKFKDVDPDFDALENYPGFGYRWRSGTAASG